MTVEIKFMKFYLGWQSHQRHFAIFVTQAKFNVIMIWTNGFDFL